MSTTIEPSTCSPYVRPPLGPDERLGPTELACIGFIAVAALLLSLSSGHGSGAGTHASGLAVATAAVPACLAALVIYGRAQRVSRRRHHRPVTGVSYSLCAGLVYGVAGRALKAVRAPYFTQGLCRATMFVF